MDPNTALAELRALRAQIRSRMREINSGAKPTTDELMELAELAERQSHLEENLDRWLSSGGFKPADWAAA